MSLSDVQEFIVRNRRKLVFGLVVVVLASLVLGFIFREVVLEVTEEDKLPPFTLAADPGRIIGQVDLSKLASADFPASVQVYRAEKLSLTFAQADAIGWAKNFGFSSLSAEVDTPLGKIYVFAKAGEELTVTTNPRELRYTRDSAGGTGNILDSSTAVQKAKDFLVAKKLPDVSAFSSTVRYLSAIGERTTETIASEAKFVETNFSWSVDGLSILGESASDSAVRMILDKDAQVVYLSYRFLDYSFSAAQEIPLLLFSEVSSALGEEAQVVLVRPLGEVEHWTLAESYDLGFFSPESVRLVYVLPTVGDLLYPVYLFEGNAQVRGLDAQAAAYVLAIPDQYIREK